MGAYFQGVLSRFLSLPPLGVALLVLGAAAYGVLAFFKKRADESKVFKLQLLALFTVFVGTIICFL
ncbi:MAG: hypothetical protein E7334_08830 [Clostridiales bacterium]|nr:hypothetical protein [Clostridiales bacterium]MBQ2818136.1 hypothetical protein [Clostridia bacterium]